MLGAIIEIIIGYVIWEYVPQWIHVSSSTGRDIIRVLAAVIGLIMIISGAWSLIKGLLSLF